jgi:hypothetical protein
MDGLGVPQVPFGCICLSVATKRNISLITNDSEGIIAITLRQWVKAIQLPQDENDQEPLDLAAVILRPPWKHVVISLSSFFCIFITTDELWKTAQGMHR